MLGRVGRSSGLLLVRGEHSIDQGFEFAIGKLAPGLRLDPFAGDPQRLGLRHAEPVGKADALGSRPRL
jgi:hypothetical protein